MNGRARIEAERQKQKDVHGWTAEHDAQHRDGELFLVGECYADLAERQTRLEQLEQPTMHPGDKNKMPELWPPSWAEAWWRPSADPARNWEKAGALFQAEIDRRRHAGITDEKLTDADLEFYVQCCAGELDRRAAGLPPAKRYLGVMTLVAVPRASGGVPGYDVRYPNGNIDWSPAAVFDTHCFELGETDDVTEALAERFHTNIGGALDLEDASTSMLATLVSWGKFGHAELTAPVTNGLRCSLHCPFLTEDSDCAKHRDPKGHYCECEVDEAAETGEVGPLRCPLCLELHPVETPADVPADLLIHNPEGR